MLLAERMLWPWRLERRVKPSAPMRAASSPIAIGAMLLTGFVALSAIGINPFAAFRVFFIEPISSLYGVGELLLKATPLMLCALGLAPGYRANVWNIGAEGQFTIGAIVGAGIGLYCNTQLGAATLPL